MTWRHEVKQPLNVFEATELQRRISHLLTCGEHGVEGAYEVRSLYFDTPEDKALKEKVAGLSRRAKFRIRMYGRDATTLHLEKKVKNNQLGKKVSCELSKEEVLRLCHGEYAWALRSERVPLNELAARMHTERMQGACVVLYERKAWCYAPGNCRVTLDTRVCTSLRNTDLLDYGARFIPATDAAGVLEVKWDAWLPDVVKNAVQIPSLRSSAFSKYAQARVFD